MMPLSSPNFLETSTYTASPVSVVCARAQPQVRIGGMEEEALGEGSGRSGGRWKLLPVWKLGGRKGAALFRVMAAA